MRYKPTWSSFLGSAVFALSPAIVASVMTFFLWENVGVLMLIGDSVMAILSLFMLIQATFVHLQRVYVDEEMISVVSPLLRIQIEWSEVIAAILRERENVMTRTDHLLILRTRVRQILFNTSTLSNRDEEHLLDFVRRKVTLVVKKDKPSV